MSPNLGGAKIMQAGGQQAKELGIAGALKMKKSSGALIYFSVYNVDEFHAYLVSKKIKPASKPLDQPWAAASSVSATRMDMNW